MDSFSRQGIALGHFARDWSGKLPKRRHISARVTATKEVTNIPILKNIGFRMFEAA
jgi:hypothetical protein